MTETGDAANAEAPDFRPLQDAMVSYARAAAEQRMMLDRLVATWRDWLHGYLKILGSDPRLVHRVIDSMDDFLNHRSKN